MSASVASGRLFILAKITPLLMHHGQASTRTSEGRVEEHTGRTGITKMAQCHFVAMQVS